MIDVLTTALIAIGLGVDCFAVSITRGLLAKEDRVRTSLLIASFFGFFQAGMCLIGYAAGEGLVDHISGFDHWIAFALLLAVGIKMINESRKDEEVKDGLEMKTLLVLSVATSIDSLAVGLSLAFLETDILASALMIGAASFMLSIAGFFIGNKAVKRLGSKAELAGGVILVAIGLRIVLEHMGMI